MTFSTGLSALRANQTAMSVVGHNLANVSTEGFRRQEVMFSENVSVEMGGFSIGTGVSIADIRSASNGALTDALVESASQGGTLKSRLDTAKQVETLFMPGTGNVQERTEELFLSMKSLSGSPTESTLRSAVVHNASELSDEINRVVAALDDMIRQGDREIQEVIAQVGVKSAEIADLNSQIAVFENTGKNADALRNQRDVFVRELAVLIDVERKAGADGTETFLLGGGMFSVDTGLGKMQLIRNEEGALEVWKEGCDAPFEIKGGKLAGLLAQGNEPGGLNSIREDLVAFTQTLVGHLDDAHAMGVGIGGAMASLKSGRQIKDASATLATQETIIPTEPGRLFVSINDTNLNQTVTATVDFDPQVDSLTDFAQNIGAVDHLSARVDELGRISIVADPGFTFDFSGNLQTRPDASAISGSTAPTISGRYEGSENEELSFEFLGTGTVGVTEDLQVAVVNGNGLTVRVLDVGADYEPSSKLVVGDGIELALASGTAAVGDRFSLQVAAKPDETGILTALGVNTLFVGSGPPDLAVNPLVKANPSLLATTTNGEPSDTRNLHRMLEVRDARILGDGTVTVEQFLSDLMANVGSEAAELARDLEANEANSVFLQSELDSIVGVDVNEELAKMLQYQRSYQAAARYMSTVDDLLQELFGIIR